MGDNHLSQFLHRSPCLLDCHMGIGTERGVDVGNGDPAKWLSSSSRHFRKIQGRGIVLIGIRRYQIDHFPTYKGTRVNARAARRCGRAPA